MSITKKQLFTPYKETSIIFWYKLCKKRKNQHYYSCSKELTCFFFINKINGWVINPNLLYIKTTHKVNSKQSTIFAQGRLCFSITGQLADGLLVIRNPLNQLIGAWRCCTITNLIKLNNFVSNRTIYYDYCNNWFEVSVVLLWENHSTS